MSTCGSLLNSRYDEWNDLFGGSTLNNISAYALQAGLDEEEKKSFWEVLNELVQDVPIIEKIFIR